MSLSFRVRRFAALLVLGFALGGRWAGAAEIPKGRVLETVACAADPKQTYALYIPTAFDPAKKWPVLLCFDPGARGKVPVERFQAAAEKFGWLVAGSNNSRNGPWDANAAAINAMLTDLNKHLPLESKRIYAAGLSGGARVACQIALGGLAQGVIACSAGFPGSEVPSRVPFAFFGTAGVTDFNYRELRRVARDLDDNRAVHRVVIFDGGHEWLPPALALEALEWLELHAMRTSAKPKDAAWIEIVLATRLGAVPAEPPLENYRALKSIAADFKGLADTAAWEKKAAGLAASREVRDALKAEKAHERTEEAVMESLLAAAADGFGHAVRKTVTELQAKAAQAANGDTAERTMAVRVLHGVASSCGEAAREALRQDDFAAAVPWLEMAVLVRPERTQAHFDLARARASLGDRKRAIAALQQAVTAGFRDAARVKAEKAFDKLRTDPEFVAVVETIK
jgi:predicted esterase